MIKSPNDHFRLHFRQKAYSGAILKNFSKIRKFWIISKGPWLIDLYNPGWIKIICSKLAGARSESDRNMSDEFYCVTVTSSQCKQQILQQQFYNIDNQIQGATTNNNHLLPSSKSCSCTTSIHVNSCIHLLMYMRSYVIHVRILCKNVCLTKC